MVPVLPRYIKTSSLLSEEDDKQLKTSVADYIASRHPDVNLNIDGMITDILRNGNENDFDVDELVKTSVADYIASKHQDVDFNIDGMITDIIRNGNENDFDVDELVKTSVADYIASKHEDVDFNIDGMITDIIRNGNKDDFEVEETKMNSTAAVAEPPDGIDDSYNGQTEDVDKQNFKVNEISLNSSECADVTEPLDGIDDLYSDHAKNFDDKNFIIENVEELVMNGTESAELLDTPEAPEADGIDDDYYDESDDDIRDQVLSVALDNVPLYGWSTKSIEKAVEVLELSPASAEMFKRGGLDLVLFFIEEGNNTLIEHLANKSKELKLDTEEARAEFIEKAIKTRLQMIIPYIDSWPQALQLMTSPSAAQEVFENGANLIDEIWYHSGDVATDMSWYAKRGALASIYITTELHMLNDKSVDYRDTWAFLHRRLNDARALNTAKDSLTSAAGDTLALVSAGITTAQNI